MDLSKITAILVLYRCRPEDSTTLNSINQAAKNADFKLSVFLYDNSPEPTPFVSFSNIDIRKVQHDPANPGVSSAYNFFAKAVENTTEWLLLLDQDTAFPDDFFTELNNLPDQLEAELVLPQLMQGTQLISPHKFRWGYSHSEENLEPGIQSLKHRSALNSGMLVKTRAFCKAGGYAEDVPLYFSDQVFIWRLKKSGIRDFYLLRSVCRHSMSSNDMRDTESFKQRYQLFIEGARAAKKYFNPFTRYGLSAVVLMRGTKLSLRHNDSFYARRSFSFIR